MAPCPSAQVCDFGLSQSLDQEGSDDDRTNSPAYAAPERWKGLSYDGKADVSGLCWRALAACAAQTPAMERGLLLPCFAPVPALASPLACLCGRPFQSQGAHQPHPGPPAGLLVRCCYVGGGAAEAGRGLPRGADAAVRAPPGLQAGVRPGAWACPCQERPGQVHSCSAPVRTGKHVRRMCWRATPRLQDLRVLRSKPAHLVCRWPAAWPAHSQSLLKCPCCPCAGGSGAPVLL